MVDYIIVTELDRIFRNYFTNNSKTFGSPEICTRLALFGTSYIFKKFHNISVYKEKLIESIDSRKNYITIINDIYVVQMIHTVIAFTNIFYQNNDDYFINYQQLQRNQNIPEINHYNVQISYDILYLNQIIPKGIHNMEYTFENIPIKIRTICPKNDYLYNNSINSKDYKLYIYIEKQYFNNQKYVDYYKFIERFLNHCNNVYKGKTNKEGKLSINTIYDKKWQKLTDIKARTFETIYGEFSSLIKKDVYAFINEKKFRELHNIPDKIAILLHGPPGTGKTTLTHAIMNEFKRNGYKITFQENNIFLEDYIQLIKTIPPGSVIILDDIDIQLLSDEKYAKINPDGKVKITYDTILSWLDATGGLPDDTILVINTNHVAKLAPAIRRSGRIDLEYYIPPANQNNITKFFQDFYTMHRETIPEGYSSDMALRFTEKFFQKHKEPTIADAQAYLLTYIHDPVNAICRL